MGKKRKAGEGTLRLRKDGRWEGRIVVDYDENGKTELKDAYAIQADVLAKKTFTADQIAKCDVNHDGKISLKDASLIQQYRAGLVVLK